MSRALVTGACGFVGPYLIRYLLKLGYEVIGGVYGTGRRDMPEGCHPVPLDVTDIDSLVKALAEVRPDEVYHLAGLSRPASGRIKEIYRVNSEGALNLLEAVCNHTPKTGLLLVGSAHAYGRVDRRIPETAPLKPVDHYGVSKASADMLSYSYALKGLRIVRARPFNHSGPGQSPDFILPSLVWQLAEIRAGKREPIVRLGNLDSVRDFSDVRDIVRGYHRILQRGGSGEAYNLGSGSGVSVKKLFELISEKTGVEAELRIEPLRVRATDIPYLVADAGKACTELGWQTEIPLEQTVRDMMEAARNEPMAREGSKA